MATATDRAVEGNQVVALRGIGWRGYLDLLRLRGGRRLPKIVYLDGTAWLMSPAYIHERYKSRFARFVPEVAFALGIGYAPAASTTFRRESEEGGVEGDETYYFAHEPMIRGKEEIRLDEDPPPDLAIEVVNTRDAYAAIEIYRRFAVPEVWVWDDDLRILVLGPEGSYVEAESSLVLAPLTAREISEWIGRPTTGSELEWDRDLRRWASEVLAPRVDRRAD